VKADRKIPRDHAAKKTHNAASGLYHYAIKTERDAFCHAGSNKAKELQSVDRNHDSRIIGALSISLTKKQQVMIAL
jgi:hypothetical protein